MITETQARQGIRVHFSDGRAFRSDLTAGQPTVEMFVNAAFPNAQPPIVGALVDGKLRELVTPLERDVEVTPITSAESDGMRIYRRSLTFLLIAAATELFPDVSIQIQHSMPSGGYYCERADGLPFTQRELDRLEERMRELVSADLPIESITLPLEEALTHFHNVGDTEKAELFERRRKGYLKLYQLNNVRDYFHGFMVPRTSYLNTFNLQSYNDGFILRFPRRREPTELQPFDEDKWLAEIFQKYKDWLKLIGAPNVAALNRSIQSDRITEVILIAEALHLRQLARIANNIRDRGETKIILISGPTSAGKTTFSKRLAVQLLARGIRPVAMGLDNYFVNRADTPRDEQGDYDYEHIDAVDVGLFTKHLRQLLAGETIAQPIYNFLTGERESGPSLRLRPDQVLIIEGIHGLNPALVDGIPDRAIYRIFISAFTQLNLDRHNRTPTTDTRKLRRMVRDFYHRGYNAAQTIRRWPKVRKGEKRWIFPYQRNADSFFNSALVYEMSALKSLAEPILLQVEPDTPERIEANRLRAYLQWFDPLSDDARNHIPSDSLIREFIGGSIMEDFEPWRD